jgi:UDP-N-acetyl-2-amino-2-deoxyglucuronate dehydrogenase
MSAADLGVAILGAGKVADAHALGFTAEEGCRVLRVLDVDPVRAAALAARYEATPAATIEEVLGDPAVDILSICTPHPTHAELAIAGARAGRHILVEKPMALSVQDCDRMIEAADRAGVCLGVVSQRRFYPPVQRMRRALDEHRIGRPILSTLELLGWRGREYYAMDPWRGTIAGEGGGVLVTQATHQLDVLLWFAGRPVWVSGRHATLNHPGIEVEDTAVAIIEFHNGGLGTIAASNGQYPGLWGRIRIHGETGASIGVEVERGSSFVSGVSSRVEPALIDTWTIPGEEGLVEAWRAEDLAMAESVDGTTYYHGLQIADFVRAIRDGGSPLVTGQDGRAVVALFAAIYESNRTRRPVTIPAAT